MSKTILITGATGLVGKAITELCLKNNYTVHYLTTKKSKLKTEPNLKGFYWDLDTNEIDNNCFNNVETIINLAGATIAKRWTSSYKKEILDSRVKSLQLLHNAISKHNTNVKQLITASAIGIYPSSLTQHYNETHTTKAKSFLGDVVNAWENEAHIFNTINIKVAKVRIGLVLDKNEGALPKLVNPVKLGLGAAMGSGKQWQSWIHKHDLARLFMHITNNQLHGVYNGTAPNPVTNLVLTKSIAKTLKRPMFLPNTPKFLLKLLLGEMHQLLFESQFVIPKNSLASGFTFKFNTIDETIKNLIG